MKKAKHAMQQETAAENRISPQEPERETTDVSYSTEEVEEILDELEAAPKPKRVWEVDFLRGFMILFVVLDHFFFDVRFAVDAQYKTGFFQWLEGVAELYQNSAVNEVTHSVFVTMFVFTSGVSCSFSSNNGKRAIKMIIFALALTAATFALSSVTGFNYTIRFNVIHVIALSVLLWTFIEWIWKRCKKNWQKNVFGFVMTAIIITVLVVGGCANAYPWTDTNPVWFFLAFHKGEEFRHFVGGDYLAFFPDFGWFLVGAFLGRFLYKDKKTLFPSVNPKFVSPVTFCGRNSLWVYFISQIVLFAFFWFFHGMLNWL